MRSYVESVLDEEETVEVLDLSQDEFDTIVYGVWSVCQCSRKDGDECESVDQEDKVSGGEGEVMSGGESESTANGGESESVMSESVSSEGDDEFVASEGDSELLADERDHIPKRRYRTPRKHRRNPRSTRNEKNARAVDNTKEVKPTRSIKRMNGRKTIHPIHISSDSESSKEDSEYEAKQQPDSKPYRTRRRQNTQPTPPRKSPRLHNHVDYKKMLE